MSDSDKSDSSKKNTDKLDDGKPPPDKGKPPTDEKERIPKEGKETIPSTSQTEPLPLSSECTFSFESAPSSITEAESLTNEKEKKDGAESALTDRMPLTTDKGGPGDENDKLLILKGEGQDDSVRIDIEDGGQSAGDIDKPTDTGDEYRINIGDESDEVQKKKMEEIVNLETDAPLTGNIRPPKVIWAFAGMMDNQVPLQGEKLVYDPSRNDFVRKVFTVVFMMLALTFFYALIVAAVPAIKDIYSDKIIGLFLLVCAMVVMFIMHYVMFCSECSRYPPCNFICLGIAVLAMGTMTSVLVLRYKVEIVIMAFLITAGTVLFCLCLASTSFDFTRFFLYFVVISVAFSLTVLGLMMARFLFNFDMKPFAIGILIVSIILSVISLIMELQMILGGRAIEIGVHDWALASYMLYTSIINLFLQILRLLGLLDD